MVRIARPSSDGAGTFSVFVDGAKAGSLDAGDEIDLPVAAGTHRLQLKFLYISSPALDVAVTAGEVRAFRAERAFGFGPFDVRYFTQRRSAIRLDPA